MRSHHNICKLDERKLTESCTHLCPRRMAPLGGPAAAVAASMPTSPSAVQTAMQSAQSVPASSPLEARCNLRGKTMAEYIFIGGTGGDLRSKTRVLDSIPSGPEDCPVLTFDGTLTGQVRPQMCQDASCS